MNPICVLNLKMMPSTVQVGDCFLEGVVLIHGYPVIIGTSYGDEIRFFFDAGL